MSDWQRMGVVLKPDTPFETSNSPLEVGRIQNFTSTAVPLTGEEWRIWYSCYPESNHRYFNIAIADGVPFKNMVKHQALLTSGKAPKSPLSIGNLPDGWRPIQPVYIKLSSTRHRLYFWAHGPGIVRYLCAESDDGNVFEVLNPFNPCLYHFNDRAVETAADGMAKLTSVKKQQHPSWEKVADPAMVCNDATNVYRLPDGTFELYTPQLVALPDGSEANIKHDNLQGFIRVIERRTSIDGLVWSPGTTIIKPDAGDPYDLQFYYLSVTRLAEQRVGILGHYRASSQTMDMEWCFSDDGINWRRPYREPFFDRDIDKSGLYGVYAPHNLVFNEDKWWLFYSGTNVPHNNVSDGCKIQKDIRLAVAEKLEFP